MELAITVIADMPVSAKDYRHKRINVKHQMIENRLVVADVLA